MFKSFFFAAKFSLSNIFLPRDCKIKTPKPGVSIATTFKSVQIVHGFWECFLFSSNISRFAQFSFILVACPRSTDGYLFLNKMAIKFKKASDLLYY